MTDPVAFLPKITISALFSQRMPLRSTFTFLLNIRTLTSTRCASSLARSLPATRPGLFLPPQSALLRSMSIVPKTMKVLLVRLPGLTSILLDFVF